MDRISSQNVEVYLSNNLKSGDFEIFHIVYWIIFLNEQGNIFKFETGA